jgi:flagellar biosynthesis protein FlhB
MAEQDQEKTEEPSQKRLEEARKRGQIYQSREVNSFLLIFALALIIGWGGSGMMKDTGHALAPFLTQPDMLPTDAGGLGDVLKQALLGVAGVAMVPLIAFVVAALFASTAQKPLILSWEPVMPKWEKISFVKGLKRLFSMRSVMEFLKGIIKIIIVGAVAMMAVWPQRGQLLRLADTEMEPMLLFLQDLVGDMLTGILIALFFIALADYLYQRFDYIKNLRMTRQELKDEYKQQEGDPIVKQRIRQLRMERARKRMMAEVPTSDVVITNPTHYAVALKYERRPRWWPRVQIWLRLRFAKWRRNIMCLSWRIRRWQGHSIRWSLRRRFPTSTTRPWPK